jgi:RNA polymerase sigma-54 factor
MQLTPSLGLRQKRTLAMTAQLREAISLLQYNNAELHEVLAEKVAQNPFLELRRGSADEGRAGAGRASIPAAPSDAARRQAAEQAQATYSDRIAGPSEGLAGHVTSQIRLAFSDPTRERIAYTFLQALEPFGWLGERIETVAAKAGCCVAEAEEVLAVLQQFEPAGLFARSLAECLRIQAADRGELSAELDRVLENLDMVAEGDLDALAGLCGCDLETLRNCLSTLRQFDPKPGLAYDSGGGPIRAPDLLLVETGSDWAVELNGSTLPGIVIREDLVLDAQGRAAFVAEALAGARMLRRAIEQRNASTLAVASEIARRQSAYLHGKSLHPVPLKLQDVADTLQLHASTVSRVTSGMTMDTPRGVMDLREFFARGLPCAGDGDGVATGAIMQRIRTMIANEEADHPLSDARITELLRTDHVQIQRRTVAKYRKSMDIPGSAARRRNGLVPPAR